MEINFDKYQADELSAKVADILCVFGQDGANKLSKQISHDNPSLTEDEVIEEAWSIIPEATAYMMPADHDTLTQNAIIIHEGYEAFRRVQD
jgi:hypothetical protein